MDGKGGKDNMLDLCKKNNKKQKQINKILKVNWSSVADRMEETQGGKC